MATETWVLKSSGMTAPDSEIDTTINFHNAANDNFTRINIYSEGKGVHISYFNNSTETSITTGGVGVTGDNATITFATAPTGALLTWLEANGTKQSTPKVTVDLTSLSGYESLAAGTYALGVKAKASGYQDSDLSQTVSFTKLAAPVATAVDTIVSWDAITNAESYDVYVDGELYENTTGGG